MNMTKNDPIILNNPEPHVQFKKKSIFRLNIIAQTKNTCLYRYDNTLVN